jgi:hypothetical protein
MMRAEVFRALAGPLMLMLAACASPGPGSGDFEDALPYPGKTLPPVPCNALIIDGANYADELALHREEQMKLMRFGSEAAMNAYIADTQRLRTEAERITMRLDDILQRYGGIADYHFIQFESPTAEEAAARIAAADACADEALK